MAENKIYLALGEEAVRGIKEAGTVGYIALSNPSIPKMEFDDKPRGEFRGQSGVKGESSVRRLGQKWSAAIEMPFFTEAGGAKGMVATLLKHFFGKAASAPNGATGQYHHMFYPVGDPFSASNLSTKALTINLNINQGPVMKNWPYVGGRVSSLNFDQVAGSHLSVSADLFGQFRDSLTAEIGTPVFADENLRADYNNLTIYTGAITRVGAAPDYTDFSFASATAIKPDKISVKIENGMEDSLRLSGLNYPDKTRLGVYKVTVEMTLDWEDPASGFSSANEFNNWMADTSETNLFLHWDTLTQAGSGDNHSLYLDIPRARRTGGAPEYNLDKDPMITLSYEGLYDEAGTGYIIGCMLKNSAGAI